MATKENGQNVSNMFYLQLNISASKFYGKTKDTLKILIGECTSQQQQGNNIENVYLKKVGVSLQEKRRRKRWWHGAIMIKTYNLNMTISCIQQDGGKPFYFSIL